MTITTVNVTTGEVSQREMTPEEIAALPPPQPAPIPQQCSGRQGQKALLRTPYGEDSNMLAAVKALIASIPDDFMREDAELDFNASTWERNNQTLQALWSQLGGTEAQLDDLFRVASTL
jgi:hypothetical protein